MRRFYKKFVQRPLRALLYCAFRALEVFFKLLGPALSRQMGIAIGALAGAILPHERRVAAANLALAMPHVSARERNRLRAAAFRHFGESAAELLHIERALAGTTLNGVAILKETASQQGALVLSGHIGNWEVLGAAVARAGVPLTVIAKRIYDPRFDRWMRGWRSRFGIETIVREEPDTVKKMLAALAQKRVLVMLIDQDTNVPSHWAPFFGKLAKTPNSAARLAANGTPVFIAGVRRLGPWRHQGQIRRLQSLPDQAEALTARFNYELEQEILAAPAEWVWFHARWRTPPPAPAP